MKIAQGIVLACVDAVFNERAKNVRSEGAQDIDAPSIYG
jgi:hypothetical protein